MKPAPTLLAPLFLALPALANGPSTEWASLVPNNAAVLVQARSIRDLVELVDELRHTTDPDAEPFSVPELISELGVGRDLLGVDLDAPAAMAWSISPMMQSSVTVIVPFEDPRAFLASYVPKGAEPRVAGRWVGIPLGSEYATGHGTHRLVDALPPRSLVARVDLKRLLTLFGPLIRVQLDELERLSESGVDLTAAAATPILGVYLDLARDFVDSADLLEVSLAARGTRLVLRARLDTLPESPLASWASDEPVDFRMLAARVTPDAAIQVGGSFDAARYLEGTWSFYESILGSLRATDELPPELDEAFEIYLSGMREITSQLGDVSSSSMDFGPDGLRFSGGYRAQAPVTLADSVLTFLRQPALAKVGLRSSEPERSSGADRGVVSTRLSFDLAGLVGLLPQEDAPDADELADAERVVEVFLGEGGLPLDLSADGEWLWVVAGGDERERGEALKRLAWPDPQVPVHMELPCDELEGANPGMFVRYDVGRLLGSMGELMHAVFPDEENPFPTGPAAFVGWWGVRNTAWAGGLSFDVGELAEYFGQM